MTKKKTSFILILGFLLIFVPLTSTVFNFEDRTVETEIPSVSAAPVITDIGGGKHDLDTVWENYTGNFPWEFDDSGSWTLFWYVNYTSDAPIWYYFYNATYGSLDGYNGSFTALYETSGPGMDIGNKMVVMEGSNPDELVNFGWEVKVWIEDSDGLVSAPVTKILKYYNGTIEEPSEELEFEATAQKTIINPNETIVIDFDISDPDGPRTYQVNYTCDFVDFETISHVDVTAAAAIFTPGVSIYAWWDDRVTFNFTFNLTVWESSVMVDSLLDTAIVYVTSPPENGTCTVTPNGVHNDIHYYNISCSGWEDELDGDGPFFYRCISRYDRDNPDYHTPMHEGTYETEFQLTVDQRHAGVIILRVYDSHDAYTEYSLDYLGRHTPGGDIPGYSIYIMLLSIIPVAGAILWKIKRKQ